MTVVAIHVHLSQCATYVYNTTTPPHTHTSIYQDESDAVKPLEANHELNHHVLEAIKGLQRDFRERVSKIRSSFEIVSLSAIKELLKELPAGEVKGQVGLLLSRSDNFSAIMSSDSIDHLFMNLSNIQAWDFLHPQLLEYLVQELGDDEARGNMQEYKACLVQFRR